MAKIIDNVKAVTTSVTSLKKELQTIYTTLNQINTMAGKTMSAVKHVTAGGGAMGLTQGSNLNLGVQNANFAIGTQNPQQQPGNGVNQGLASSAVMEQQRYQTSIAAGSGAASKAVLAGQIGGNLLSGALGIVGGAYQALPDLGMTVAKIGRAHV